MPRILITPSTLANIDAEFIPALRQAGFDLVFPSKGAQLDEDELDAHLPGIDATLAGSEPYTTRVLEAHPQLRVIARVGVGYDAVDIPAATRLGRVVTIAPNTNQDAVAEHTFALMLALAKDLVSQHLAVKTAGWPRRANLPLRNKTLGVAGLGRIGKAVAVRGKVFGMRLVAYEPYSVDTAFVAEHGVQVVGTFEELLERSDYVSLHMPLNAETRYLINQKTLAQMKPTAFLINTARGGLVCEADLLAALRARKIAGAGLDVFEQEPPGANPLCELDNVVLTPHAAGVDTQSRDDMALSAALAVVALYRGEWPEEKIVNRELKGRFRWKV
jgi:phosphoglycerate dehydrogenase-like enzyme